MYKFWGKWKFWNDKMHNYVKQSISSLAGKFLSFLSLYTFWEKCVYFSIFNDELCFVWHNCAFLSFKNWKRNTLSSKNVQTEKAVESLILTEREETKTRYSAPMSLWSKIISETIAIINIITKRTCISPTFNKITD